jgi:hypothetical protein
MLLLLLYTISTCQYDIWHNSSCVFTAGVMQASLAANMRHSYASKLLTLVQSLAPLP